MRWGPDIPPSWKASDGEGWRKAADALAFLNRIRKANNANALSAAEFSGMDAIVCAKYVEVNHEGVKYVITDKCVSATAAQWPKKTLTGREMDIPA